MISNPETKRGSPKGGNKNKDPTRPSQDVVLIKKKKKEKKEEEIRRKKKRLFS